MTEQQPQALDPQHFDGPRAPRLDEREPLLSMINEIFRVTRGLPPTIGTDWAHVYAPENLANVNVIFDPGAGSEHTPVASTGVWANDVVVHGARLRVGGINCVGTLPEYRRFGLGTQTMAAAHATLRRLGCHVGLLSTGIANWYRRLQWEEAGMVRTYLLNRGNVDLLPALPSGLTLRLIPLAAGTITPDPAVLDALLRLAAQAPLGGIRTPALLRQLLEARRVEQVAFLEGDAGPLAYGLLHGHTLIEWGGETRLVAALVRAWFDRLDDPRASTSARSGSGAPAAFRTLQVQTPGWSHPLVLWFDEWRLPFHSDYLGMLYLVDPQAILDAYGIRAVRVVPDAAGPEAEWWRVEAGPVSMQLDRRQLTKLFFGPERISPALSDIFPLPFWQWRLDHV